MLLPEFPHWSLNINLSRFNSVKCQRKYLSCFLQCSSIHTSKVEFFSRALKILLRISNLIFVVNLQKSYMGAGGVIWSPDGKHCSRLISALNYMISRINVSGILPECKMFIILSYIGPAMFIKIYIGLVISIKTYMGLVIFIKRKLLRKIFPRLRKRCPPESVNARDEGDKKKRPVLQFFLR